MGKKSKSSSSSQTYTPSAEEKALQQQALEYSKYVMPNAKKLNDTAANMLYGSLGSTQVDYNDLMNNALDQIKWGQQGLRGLAQGQIPTAYQDAMEASIKKGVQGSMGNLLQDMGARGVVNSSVMDTGLRGISDSASDAMAQNWQNTVSQLANIYGQNIDAAGQPIATAAAAQEGAQQPAINLWNASLGLNGSTTGALGALAGKGTTTTTQKTSGGGLFGVSSPALPAMPGLFSVLHQKRKCAWQTGPKCRLPTSKSATRYFVRMKTARNPKKRSCIPWNRTIMTYGTSYVKMA